MNRCYERICATTRLAIHHHTHSKFPPDARYVVPKLCYPYGISIEFKLPPDERE